MERIGCCCRLPAACCLLLAAASAARSKSTGVRSSRHQLGVEGASCSFVFQAPSLEYSLHITRVEVVQRSVQSATDDPRNTRGKQQSRPGRVPVGVRVDVPVREFRARIGRIAQVVAGRVVAEICVEECEDEGPEGGDGSLQRSLPSNDERPLTRLGELAENRCVGTPSDPSTDQMHKNGQSHEVREGVLCGGRNCGGECEKGEWNATVNRKLCIQNASMHWPNRGKVITQPA